MQGFIIALVVLIVIGIVLIIVSLFLSGVRKNDGQDYARSNAAAGNDVVNELNASLSEADKTIEELNSTAKSILKDVDEKYQELMFLYSLVDEMKKDAAKMYAGLHATEIETAKPYEPPVAARHEDFPRSVEFYSEKQQRVAELFKQGLTMAEIAKSLGIGQGEVKMILDLRKV